MLRTLSFIRPTKKQVLKIGSVVALLCIAPPVGLYFARDTNTGANMSAPNAVVGAAATVVAPGTKLVKNDFAGVLLPPHMANLSTQFDGRVESVPVKIGQPVHQGDVILKFDPRQRKHDLAQATAALKSAQAQAGAASSEMIAARKRATRRNASVSVNGQSISLVSGEEAAQAESDARTAAAKAGSAGASIGEAQARVDALQLALEETEVKAPFDGVVTAIFFEPGTTAHAGEAIARVVGGNGLRVRFAVAEEDVGILRDRHRSRVTLENSTFWATIDQVSPEVEPASRAFIVEGPVDGGDSACGPAGCAMIAGRAVRVSLEAPPAAAAPNQPQVARPPVQAPPPVQAAAAAAAPGQPVAATLPAPARAR